MKQNKYPVLFLCVGHTIKHIPFVDERTQTSMTAVEFAAGMELMVDLYYVFINNIEF